MSKANLKYLHIIANSNFHTLNKTTKQNISNWKQKSKRRKCNW